MSNLLNNNVIKCVTTPGKRSYIWTGPRPTLLVIDSELIREVLAKSYVYQKIHGGNPLTKLLAQGLASHDTDKWSKHRRLITPAFHLEKLKVISACVQKIW